VSIVDKDLATIAFCWRIERRDGVTLGYTSHDRELEIGGLLYRSTPGMLPSAIALTDGFDESGLEVSGALRSEAITAADLHAGRWDGAAAAVFMVDWEALEAEPIDVARGDLGDVSISRNAFEAELRGLAAALDRPVVEQTSPECRAELGDKRCRVDLAPLTFVARIAAVPSTTSLELSAQPAGRRFRHGKIRWLSGENSGLGVGLVSCDSALVTLRDVPHFLPAEGDLVEIVEGCDKSIATCSDRFANALNFRGEPHLPGMDLLTRYPGA
jgi:uncharacterized phage protein (TIGR02218 family)